MPQPETTEARHPGLSPRYLATLVVAAVAILVVGSALRPRKPASEAVPPPSQTEIQRLQRLAQRRSLETMTEHFATLAGDVAGRILQVGVSSSSGVAWTSDLVIGPGEEGPAAASTTLVTASGEQLPANRVVGGPDLPLAGFQVAGRLEPAARRDASAPAPTAGQWLVAVWRGNTGHVFAPGHYVETRPARCGELDARELVTTIPLREHMAGGGLFDLDEALVALVLPCDGRYVALSLESVTRGLSLGRTVEGRLLALFGLRAQLLGEAGRAFLGVERGALVSEVWAGYPADRGGLRPGDVVTALGERPVSTPEDLQVLLSSPDAAGWAATLWRARRRVEVHLPTPASDGPEGAASPPTGLRLEGPPPGFRIATVAPGSAAAEGGIQPGDRLLRIDFASPRTAADVGRTLDRSDAGPTFVEVARGARRFGVLLPRVTAR